jgi:cystathionine beta-lyase
VESLLQYENGRYSVDFQDFENKIVQNHVKLFILCSPHNPICRVWTREELQRIGDICRRHGVKVVSDEIHCDFAFPEHPHHIFLEAMPELAERSIVCTAPSKTFNLAGLQVSNIWIPDKENRARFCEEMDRCGCGLLNTLGLTACQAAYENGGEWLEQCKSYLRENLDYLRSFLRERIAQIRLVEPEGTYFAWLDCSGLGLSCQELNDLIAKQAKLWLDAGHIFSPDSGQFQRIVLACPRSVLAQALEQLETAIKQS